MTTTQVQYWALQETKRHNLAYEQEVGRHNVVSEGLEMKSLTETKRHNIAVEKLSASSLKETKRHNVVSEKLSATQIAENKRHNLASEVIGRQQAIASQTAANAAVMQANAALQNAQTNRKLANSQITLNSAMTQLKAAETALTKTKAVGEIARALKGSKVGDYAALAYVVGQILINPDIDSQSKAVLNEVLKDAKTVTGVPTNATAAQTAAAAKYTKELKRFFVKLGISANNWSWTINQ